MIWSVFQTVGFTFFFLCSVFFVLKKKYTELLILYFWGIAFAACFKFFVTIWTPEKVVSLAMVWCILFHKRLYKHRNYSSMIRFVLAFILLLIMGNIVAMSYPPIYSKAHNPFNRMIIQSMSYLTGVVVLLYGYYLKPNFVKKLFPHYCRAVEVGIISGAIHIIALIMGIPFMPILRLDGTVSEIDTVIAEMGGELFPRVYGFAGEPKELAFLILPYLVISILLFLRGYYIKGKMYHTLFFILGVIVLIATFSSSAYIDLFIMLPFILFFSFSKLLNTKRNRVTAICGFIFVIISIVVIYKSDFGGYLYERSFIRAQTELADDRQETVIYNSFNESDWVVQIFGWGVAQYTFQVPDQIVSANKLRPVQSGLLLTLCDFGYLGCIFLIILLFFTIHLIQKSISFKSPLPMCFSLAALSKIVEIFVHGTLVTPVFYLLIAYCSYEDSIKKSNRKLSFLTSYV